MIASNQKLGRLFRLKDSFETWRVEQFKDGKKRFVKVHGIEICDELNEDFYLPVN